MGRLLARFLASLAVQGAIFALLLLGPAYALTGGLAWPRAWLAAGLAFAASAIGGLWFLRTAPDLVAERASTPRPQTRADALASGAIAVSVIGWFVAVAFDIHRWRLIDLPPVASLTLGLAAFAAGLAVIVWMFRVNAFAATVVKVDAARRQTVIDTGPYAHVRHPMYAGGIVFPAGLGLIAGSLAMALFALPLFACSFLPRMLTEERVLARDLDGYADYLARTRGRLLPKLF